MQFGRQESRQGRQCEGTLQVHTRAGRPGHVFHACARGRLETSASLVGRRPVGGLEAQARRAGQRA